MRTLQTKLAILGTALAFGACAPAAKQGAAPLDQQVSSYLSGLYDSVQDQSGRESMVKGTQVAATVTVSAIITPSSTASLGTALSNLTTSGSSSGSLPKAPAAGSGSLATTPGAGSGAILSAPAGGSSSVASGTLVGGGSGLASAPAGSGSGSSGDYSSAICGFVEGFVGYIVRCSTGATVSAAFQNFNCASFVASTLSATASQSVPTSVLTTLNCLGTAFETASCSNNDLESAFSSCGAGT